MSAKLPSQRINVLSTFYAKIHSRSPIQYNIIAQEQLLDQDFIFLMHQSKHLLAFEYPTRSFELYNADLEASLD